MTAGSLATSGFSRGSGNSDADLVKTVRELRSLELSKLEQEFGRYGVRLYELARGIDENPVVPDHSTQSISVEDTFQEEVLLTETEPMIQCLEEKLWSACAKNRGYHEQSCSI